MDKLFSDLQNNIGIPNVQEISDGLNESKQDTNKDAEKLLKKQQISTEKLNSLLEQSLTAISCGPVCQKIKVGKELEQKYLDAQTNLKTAPIQLETTKKNYYVFTKGKPFYDNMLEEELKKKAEIMGKVLVENFNEEIVNAKTMNAYYNTDVNNSDYTKELYAVYLEKNKILQDGIKNHHADVLTNDRKTYYETEAIEELKNWHYFFLIIYYVIIFPLFIFMLFTKSSLHFLVKLFVIFLMTTYPLYIDSVLRKIYHFVYSVLWKQIPKNVYNDL
jgi:hypothetical protein